MCDQTEVFGKSRQHAECASRCGESGELRRPTFKADLTHEESGRSGRAGIREAVEIAAGVICHNRQKPVTANKMEGGFSAVSTLGAFVILGAPTRNPKLFDAEESLAAADASVIVRCGLAINV